MAGLPLTQADRGDGDGFDDDDGTFRLPSHAPTDASGMPGDLDHFGPDDEILHEPEWDDNDVQCSDGVWSTKTRGGGDAEEEVEVKDNHGGTFGF